MTRATTGQWSFNGGELSPRMHGRIDQAVYAIGCETLVGWIPLLQGPVVAAPGTHFVEVAKAACRLVPFEYNVTQGYVIEASSLVFRFFTNDVRIETSPGVAYEVAHPYSYTDLLDLDYQQSADVLYLAGASKAPRKLSRLSAVTFSLSLLSLRNGPIGAGNVDETILVTASGVTGSVTLTASSGIFAVTDVGSYFELEAADFNTVKAWEPGIDGIVSGSTKCTWAGKVYLAASAGRTGTVPPSHDTGTEYDGTAGGNDVNGKGPYGVKWTFLHGRHGLLQVTAYTSATQVTATVVKRLADSLTATGSWRWAFGAFSDTRGWPDSVALWDESLVLTKGNTAYVSVIGDLENFERRDSSGDFQRDLSGQFTIPNPAKIQWAAADRLLLLGTEKGEYTVERVQVQTGTAGPPVFEVRLQSSNGCRRLKPIQADGRILFAQRAGRKLREMGYAISSDRYEAPDMTRLADHIGREGFADLAWQAEPERLAWAAIGDGSLAAMTYDPSQQVMGWCRRALGEGLAATSICRITDPLGERDQIWIAATYGAATWILRMEKIWETGDDLLDAFFVDAGLSYDGVPADEISGLDHLEGATVSILADGKPHPDRQVTAAAVTLDYEASKVHIGLAYPSTLKTLRIEAGQNEGTAQGKLKRIIEMKLRLIESLGIRVSVQDGDQIPVETRVPGDPMDEAVPLYSGDLSILTIGQYERGGQVSVERYQPTPATIVAVIPVVETGEI